MLSVQTSRTLNTMCWTCVRSEMTSAEITEIDVTPEMVRIARLIEDLYALPGCSCGGPLHITTDDNNVTDDNLAFCRTWLEDQTNEYSNDGRTPERDALCTQILDALQPMSQLERSVSCQIHHGDRYQPPGAKRSFSYPTKLTVEDDSLRISGEQF